MNCVILGKCSECNNYLTVEDYINYLDQICSCQICKKTNYYEFSNVKIVSIYFIFRIYSL